MIEMKFIENCADTVDQDEHLMTALLTFSTKLWLGDIVGFIFMP